MIQTEIKIFPFLINLQCHNNVLSARIHCPLALCSRDIEKVPLNVACSYLQRYWLSFTILVIFNLLQNYLIFLSAGETLVFKKKNVLSNKSDTAYVQSLLVLRQ